MKGAAAWVGLGLLILAAVSFAANSTSAVVSYRGGATPISVITVRMLFTIVVLYLLTRVTGSTIRLPPRDRAVSLALGLVLAIQSYALFKAIEYVPVALGVLTFYLYPLFTGVAAHVVGQERLGWRLGSALVVAFVGLVLALNVTGTLIDPLGVALAVLSAITLAAIIVIGAPLIARTGDSRPFTFHMHITAATVFVLVSAVMGELPLPQTQRAWVGFVGVSVFYAIATTAFFAAVKIVGSVRSGLVMNLEPVSSIVMGFLVLGQAMSPVQLLGAALIVGAVVAVRLGDRAVPATDSPD